MKKLTLLLVVIVGLVALTTRVWATDEPCGGYHKVATYKNGSTTYKLKIVRHIDRDGKDLVGAGWHMYANHPNERVGRGTYYQIYRYSYGEVYVSASWHHEDPEDGAIDPVLHACIQIPSDPLEVMPN